mmetsp:Transcript_47492/g.92739  ORF Transcript_47492/g.92739 Transcript_47492/m.92739 type:complete len:464 (-) Transcript_47492:80-1471(-)
MAIAAYDLGVNHFLQARLLATSEDGSGGGDRLDILDGAADGPSEGPSVARALRLSVASFLASVGAEPLFAPAWCGLGCALADASPVLAQHCLCRSLQLDRASHLSWANLSMLYVEHGADGAEEALDALTQVADSPLCWIGRGLLMESKSADFESAADAYRSALQVSQHPEALLGLSMTCRKRTLARDETGADDADENAYITSMEYNARLECNNSVRMYLSTGSKNMGTSLRNELLALEEEIVRGMEPALLSGSVQTVQQQLAFFENVRRENEDETQSSETKQAFDTVKECLAIISGAESQEIQEAEATTNTDASNAVSMEEPDDTGAADEDKETDEGDAEKKDSTDPVLLLRRAEDMAKEGTDQYARARDTAVRAYDAFHRRLLDTAAVSSAEEGADGYQKPAVPVPVDAAHISRASALVHWLSGCSERGGGGDGTAPVRASLRLQVALMMDPGNPLAVAGLV